MPSGWPFSAAATHWMHSRYSLVESPPRTETAALNAACRSSAKAAPPSTPSADPTIPPHSLACFPAACSHFRRRSLCTRCVRAEPPAPLICAHSAEPPPPPSRGVRRRRPPPRRRYLLHAPREQRTKNKTRLVYSLTHPALNSE